MSDSEQILEVDQTYKELLTQFDNFQLQLERVSRNKQTLL